MKPLLVRCISQAVTAWATGRQPLPGALCNETPEPLDGRYTPRTTDDGPVDPHVLIGLLREENRALRHRVSRPNREPILEHQLAVVTADRDRLELVVDRLRAELRELQAPTAAETTLVMPRSRSGIPPVVRRGR